MSGPRSHRHHQNTLPTHHFLERTGEQCLSAEREGACCVVYVFFKLRLKLVFRGSAHLSKVVLSHITIRAISTWSGRWTVLAGVPWASTPATFSTGGGGCIDLFVN